MDAQVAQLAMMLEIAERRADAAEAALATRRAEAETAQEILTGRESALRRHFATRPTRVAALTAPLMGSSDVRSSDILAVEAAKRAIDQEAAALEVERAAAAAARDRAAAAIRPAAEAARAARARVEKFRVARAESAEAQARDAEAAADRDD